jgi:hypothetical protein
MPIRDQHAFEPDLMEAMRRAFHKVCETLQLGDNDDAFMEIVAAKIIELAKSGEGDSERLCSEVLDGLKRKAS